MELKRTRPLAATLRQSTLYSTIMELKQLNLICLKMQITLFIAPLWNWNTEVLNPHLLGWLTLYSTIMELKLTWPSVICSAGFLFIAPLWNWNNKKLVSLAVATYLFIAPLWNWNQNIRPFPTCSPRSL